jgi:hypothetical protein
MSLKLYSDDFVTLAIETPSYSSMTSMTTNQRELTYNFNTNKDYIVQRLENFINFRNSTQTFNISQNVNNKNIGDYTCAVLDTMRS